MHRFIATVVVFAVLGGAASFAAAQEKKGATVGMLRCDEASGWGMVFGSTRDIKCVFSSEKGAQPVRFTGKIKTYGVDIGYQANAVILWAVVSTTDKFTPGDIAGDYGGVTAQAAWAVGLGANVLLGGANKGFALQPVSVQGYNGANLAAGVTEVSLAPAT